MGQGRQKNIPLVAVAEGIFTGAFLSVDVFIKLNLTDFFMYDNMKM